jgi:hypothetical protein
MNDTQSRFREALRRGFEATDGMTKLTDDICTLVAQMSVAATDVSNGRVYISSTKRESWAITARETEPLSSSRRTAELFSIVPANAGYPVHLRFRIRPPSAECANFEALRQALEDALATPEVGEEMLDLMGGRS